MTDSYLKKCNRIYEAVLAHIIKLHKGGADAGAIITWTQLLTTFTWTNHPGRYADGKLENILLELGKMLPEPSAGVAALPASSIELPADQRRKVLHVASIVYPTGGHTRLIANWVRNDKDSCHSLVLTSQEGPLPAWLREAVEQSGGCLIVLPQDTNLFSRVSELSRLARANVDVVILHHHPNDVIPVLAFASPHYPPVGIMNHADHVFGLGSTVGDLFIEYRDESREVSETRRFARKSLLLPIPLSTDTVKITRQEARERLGIASDQVMLLSIGSSYKYRPTESHNFFRTGVKLLDQNPDAHLYLIGVEWDDTVDYLQVARHERFHFLGVIEDPVIYEIASDIFLDGFPYGSFTALLDAVLHLACPVATLSHSSSSLFRLIDIALANVIKNAASETEYLENVTRLIRDKELRETLAARAHASLVDYHAGPMWFEFLQEIYQYLENTKHQPGPIPGTSAMESDHDLALSKLNALGQGADPLLLQLGRELFSIVGARDVARLLLLSLKARDSRLSRADLKGWQALLRKALRRRQAIRRRARASSKKRTSGF
jgi:hypothetical protein